MRIALITANFGNADPPRPYFQQAFPDGIEFSVFRFTDQNFPPRASMTPRLQAKIPKMYGWQLCPNFDFYIWVDSWFSIQRADAVSWLIGNCHGTELVLFRHPHRQKVREERDYLNMEIANGNQYIISRYANEQLRPEWFKGDLDIYAAGVFAYKNTRPVQMMLEEWFHEVVRYHVDDQLSLPYILEKYNRSITVIEDNILHNQYFVHKSHKT